MRSRFLAPPPIAVPSKDGAAGAEPGRCTDAAPALWAPPLSMPAPLIPRIWGLGRGAERCEGVRGGAPSMVTASFDSLTDRPPLQGLLCTPGSSRLPPCSVYGCRMILSLHCGTRSSLPLPLLLFFCSRLLLGFLLLPQPG